MELPYREPSRPGGTHVRSRRLGIGVLAAVLGVGVLSVVPAPGASATGCKTVTTDNRCGMDLERAWKHYTKGDPHVLISYIEGGINWHLDTAKQFADRVFVNWRETPVPCSFKSASSCQPRYAKHRGAYDT